MWLLLVEDEMDLAEVLEAGLEEAGYTIDVAHDGIEAEIKARSNDYDMLVVDWMLPGQDGPTLIKRLRGSGLRKPILMLTALSDIDNRVEGLDAGADDYLTKPFSFEELYARLRALSRRSVALKHEDVVEMGALALDMRRRRVTVDGEVLELRAKEYALFELLARQTDQVVTRTIIAERIWGSTFGVSDDVINMTVSSLRRKLKEAFKLIDDQPHYTIKTERGVGYQLATAA